jgi:hypothetical protein
MIGVTHSTKWRFVTKNFTPYDIYCRQQRV